MSRDGARVDSAFRKNSWEHEMRKFLITGLAGLALTGAAGLNALHAQTSDKPPPPQAEPMMKTSPLQAAPTTAPADNQIANDVDARVAQLKASLHLTVGQEKNWPALRIALHDDGIAQLKAGLESAERPRRQERGDQDRSQRPNDVALLREMAASLTARGASLKELADAADPLYVSLDDRQRRELFQFLRSDFELRRR
ncbi:Spy/CpxP family protein refolding chaperone [Rhodoblastus acidophilus]|uniref:Spy/CpxP family protein refolding chaperone n=1 Tax=Candidatus Rhodoblastus alkanivorans TaxID=2954117 RepID=A0ABS9Z9I3_9HYPH|nr:Spy/CpxP family protein refolding chaperone [Candidatus Rhodoblastus alkanivorans]MCI4678938.1 Spy/CpxP family protein refolding chaperone [Candidatus Rhodoblastus alkanivorans]MCI4683716.1 Spy/CpxP family protein refolding chaperone [Candidatus Rhodoblastus alkanivorans]MDI4641033.1 Spy/CpxP family protein refolding chaperone [Rhodoblastus acidophilus]